MSYLEKRASNNQTTAEVDHPVISREINIMPELSWGRGRSELNEFSPTFHNHWPDIPHEMLARQINAPTGECDIVLQNMDVIRSQTICDFSPHIALSKLDLRAEDILPVPSLEYITSKS